MPNKNLLACALILTGCSILFLSCSAVKTPETVVVGSNVVVVGHWDTKPPGPEWTKQTLDAINQYGTDLIEALPSDGDLYCKSYKDLNVDNRKAFWVYLISALAEYESNFDPAVTFDETTVDPKMLTREGKPIISRGLLQISRESANGYGCGISTAKELHDARTNISCAVRILNRWVGRDKVISGRSAGKWRGAARYFSPFRNATKLKHMQQLTMQQPYCR